MKASLLEGILLKLVNILWKLVQLSFYVRKVLDQNSNIQFLCQLKSYENL